MKTTQTTPTIWKRTGKLTGKSTARLASKLAMKLAVLATLGLAAAQASPVSFTFLSGGATAGSGYGNSFSTTSSGITATATAFSLSSLSGNFATAQIGRATGYGLWVCNQSEGLSCPSASHQIDNAYGWDFVLLQFSQAIDPEAISIKTYNSADLDITYYLGNAASGLSLAGANLAGLASLGFGSALSDDVNTSATSRTALLTNTGGVNSLLVAARISGDANKDYFKITGLAAETVSDVPEPGTYFLCGTALALMGIYRRRGAKA